MVGIQKKWVWIASILAVAIAIFLATKSNSRRRRVLLHA